MNEEMENRRSLEQMVLCIYSLFSVLMVITTLAVGWDFWMIPLILLGMIGSWWLVLQQSRFFRFRAFFVSSMALMNFLLYGMKAESFFGTLATMAALIILLAIYGIPEIMYLTTAGYALLLLYHLLVKRTIGMPADTLECCRMLLQIVSILTIEWLVSYYVKSQRKARLKMEEMIDSLKRTEKGKDAFLANVSHEIRTPISTICGISDILRMEELPGAIHEDMEEMYMAGRQLLAVVSDILDFSELQAGTLSVTEAPYNLSSTLNDVMNMSMAKNEKKLLIRLECDDDIPCGMVGDEQKIRRVMLNLIGNAIKFTDKGSIRIQVQARRESYGVNLSVSVRDTGIGMRPEQVEILFERFNQADMGTNRRENGLGLGLAISQRMIRQMNGFLTVRSEYGKGSEFQFVIPQRVVDSTPIPQMNYQERKPFVNSFQAPTARILVVDDNEMNLKVIRGLLRPYQIRVYTAESGEEALRHVEHSEVDFIFMDQMMPEMDGVEALHRIRNKPGDYYQSVPVIALTANAVGGAREMFLAEGFQDYLTKPIDLPALDRLLRKYIPFNKREECQKSLEAEPLPESDKTKEQTKEKQTGFADGMLDTETGLAYSGGSWENYLEVIDLFIENGTKTVQSLQRFYEESDWENYTILVHSLKGNAKGVGASELSKLAEAQEMAGRAGDDRQQRAGHAELIEACQKLLSVLKRERAREESRKENECQQGTGAKADSLREITVSERDQLFDRLKEKLEAFESEAVCEVIAEASGCSVQGVPLSGQLEEILRKVKAFDFLGAEMILDQFERGGKC